jgi:hypothetical protein
VKLTKALSEAAFAITTEEELRDWLLAVDKELGGTSWKPLGGIENNVHTVEVASDPGLALVERPTNSIDQLLYLRAIEIGQTAGTPHDAAKLWWGVPDAGLSELSDNERRSLADKVRVTMLESGTAERPTITIQDLGTGQHPNAFESTLLSLLASNKKSKTHVMGVYNAGGAASYKFCRGAIIASRLAPQLLNGSADEIGISVVRYNALDPDRYKSGVYEFLTGADGSIIRMDLQEMPDMPYGAYVKLIEYELLKYARGAHEPKSSLWHLFHAALPDPALPFRIIETRVGRFKGMKGTPERRVVAGLKYLLQRPGTADYSDRRIIALGPEDGEIELHYFVLNEDRDPDAYTTSEQGLTVMLNGQRHITKDRLWLRRQLEIFYLYKRLVVLVDSTRLTNSAKRQVFSSTRETGVDSPLTKRILDRVVQELKDDEDLYSLDELARQKTLEAATKTTTEKVKRQLANQIAAYLKGGLTGNKGGAGKKQSKKVRHPRPILPNVDDSQLLEIPDSLSIATDPLVIEQGSTAALRVEINAKNDFLPTYGRGFSVILGPELKDHVQVRSTGRLLGGRVRVMLEAAADAPLASTFVKVALVVSQLGILLTAEGKIEVTATNDDDQSDKNRGGEPNIDVSWVGRSKWDDFTPAWDNDTVGDCLIYRDDQNDKSAITKVDWILNEAYAPYESVIKQKKLGEQAMKTFREGYEYPVLFGLFKQRLAEEAKEMEADEEGRRVDVPDDYVRGERSRLARAVLMAKEPELQIAEVSED